MIDDPKPSPRPWFALWRAEKGSFAQLPLLARALFSEILKLTDDDGVIDLGAREPADAIAWALGADRADRRALAKYVPMLLADGCLVRDGSRLFAPAFPRWQPEQRKPKAVTTAPRSGLEAPANESRTDHDGATSAPRSGHDGATTELRPCHETEAKSAEPFAFAPHSRVEERRGEKRRVDGEDARARPSSTEDSPKAGPRPVRVVDLDSAIRRLRQLLDAASWRIVGAPLNGDHQAVREAATWTMQVVQGDAAAWVELTDAMLARWERDPYLRERRPPLARNFLSRLAALRDEVLGRGPAGVPLAPPQHVSELEALRGRLKGLKSARDLAVGRGEHRRVSELEREAEGIKAQIRKLKGAA